MAYPVPGVVGAVNTREAEDAKATTLAKESKALEEKVSLEISFAESQTLRECISESAMGIRGDSSIYTWLNDAKGARWQIRNQHEIVVRAMGWLRDYSPDKATPHKAAALAEWYAGHLALIGATLPRPDDKRSLVALRNGVLELERDGTITAHAPDPDFGATACIQADLPADAVTAGSYVIPAPNDNSYFQRYITSTLPDPQVRALAQEALSTILISRCYEKAIWLYGEGENGKSVLLNLLAALMPDATQAMDLNRLCMNQFGTTYLLGKRLITVPELPGFLSPETQGVLKSLISQDLTPVERKGRDPEMFRPQAVFVMASNHHPKMTEHEHGFWRKIVTIPFLQMVDPAKKIDRLDQLITEDPTELMEFINWLLEGACRLQQRGRFLRDDEMPEEVKQLRDEQRQQSDSVANFVSDAELVHDPGTWVSRDEMFAVYREFCDERGLKAVGDHQFGARLTNLLKLNKADFSRLRINGQRHRVVRVNSESFEFSATTLCVAPRDPSLPPVEVHDAQEFFNITP